MSCNLIPCLLITTSNPFADYSGRRKRVFGLRSAHRKLRDVWGVRQYKVLSRRYKNRMTTMTSSQRRAFSREAFTRSAFLLSRHFHLRISNKKDEANKKCTRQQQKYVWSLITSQFFSVSNYFIEVERPTIARRQASHITQQTKEFLEAMWRHSGTPNLSIYGRLISAPKIFSWIDRLRRRRLTSLSWPWA